MKKLKQRNQLFIAKVDKNQPVIVKAFRQLGFHVSHTHMVKRFCDIVVHKNGLNHLIEIKGEKGKLTPAEKEFHAECPSPVHIVRTPDDVLQFSAWHDKLIELGVPEALLCPPTS